MNPFRLIALFFGGLLLLAAGLSSASSDPDGVAGLPEPRPFRELPLDWFTFEPDEYWQQPNDSYWLSFSNWVLTQERGHSQRIKSIGEWADRTLSGSDQALPNNESYLRLGFATKSEYGDPAQFEPEIRFKLDVPTVEQKLRVVVESESDDLIPLSERRRDRQLTSDERSDTDATGAIRFLSDVGDAINLSNDVGVRFRIPPDAFWRAKAKKRWRDVGRWDIEVSQRFYYFHLDGWGARSWVGFSRSLGKGWRGLLASEMEWKHQQRKFAVSQVLNIYKRLNNRATLNPRFGVTGESQPNWRQTSVFADLTYRYRLYDDWLFAELIPALRFPREESFKDRASLVLRIELFFSGSIEAAY